MLFPLKDYNPTRRTAYLTIALIVVNCLVFLYQSFLSPKPFPYHIAEYSMVPYEVTHMKNVTIPVGRDRWGRTVTFEREVSPIAAIFASLFMHASLMHLVGNMLFLWIFGNNIEDYLGKFKFLIFYFLSGVGAALVHTIFHYNSMVPVIGASGAVSGVMGAYLILYPHAKVRTLVFILILITFMDIPAYIFLIVWFLYQFLYASGGSGIAWMAHVGGFVIGVLLIKLMRNRSRPVFEIIE